MRRHRRSGHRKHHSSRGKALFFILFLIAGILLVGFTVRMLGHAEDRNGTSPSFAEGSGEDRGGDPAAGDDKIPGDNTSDPGEKSLLVVIDAGHGGDDAGAQGEGLNEKDVCLDIALRLQKLLEDAGVDIYMIRTDDTNINTTERIMTANRMKASLFLSIHCNSFEDPSYGGTETLYYPSDTLHSGNLYEKEYARIIQDELVKALGLNDRGIVERPGLAVVHRAEMPSVIAEIGFLSHAKDLEGLKSDEFRQKAAEALKSGILKSLAKIP